MNRLFDASYWLWDHTLNSVKFGLVVMALIAIYVAVGSASTDLRAWFEMSDLQFFNAWPMLVLAVVFVMNMATVTIGRIPLTLPRLGVWMIHTGAITLVFGMVYYFKHKVEGMTLIRTGETAAYFYDAEERSLYVKVGSRKAMPTPLADLPRFHSYAEELGNASWLDDSLTGLTPSIWNYNPLTRKGEQTPLLEAAEFDGPPLTMDVIAYYPYAVVGRAFEMVADDPAAVTGLRMTLKDPVTGQGRNKWIVADYDGDDEELVAGAIRLRHLHREDELTGDGLLKAATQAHEIRWSLNPVGVNHGSDGEPCATCDNCEDHADEPKVDTKEDASDTDDGLNGVIYAHPGTRQPLGDTGYEVEAIEFLPAFPMFGTGEVAETLELMVYPPETAPYAKPFRRYVINGREVETDFILDAEGAGPKGERQTERLDKGLHLHYTHSDGLNLLPAGNEAERQVFLTKSDKAGFWRLLTTNKTPPVLEDLEDGKAHLLLQGQLVRPDAGPARPMNFELDIVRHDNVKSRTFVQEVPEGERDRNSAQAGTFQVATVRVSRGDWSDTVHVPFSQWVDQMPWQFGRVKVPGVDEPVQLQLAGTRRDLPGRVVLDEFELVPYAGDFTSDSMMRNFRSHLTVTPRGQDAEQVTVELNEPMYVSVDVPGPLGGYLPRESWLMYQNQWDPENQAFTVLGIGNRPGITTMVAGCILMVVGIGWAFYLKPVILKRRKEKALLEHQRRQVARA